MAITKLQGVHSPDTGGINIFVSPASITAGSLLVTAVTWSTNTGIGTQTIVQASSGDTLNGLNSPIWNFIATETVVGTHYDQIACAIAYCYNSAGGTETAVGFTFSSAVSDSWMSFYEFSGAQTSPTPFDQTSSATSTSTNPTATAVTTNYNGEVAVAIALADDGVGLDNMTQGTGWNLGNHFGGGSACIASEHIIQTSAGSLAGAFVKSGSSKWVAQMATFQPPSAQIIYMLGRLGP